MLRGILAVIVGYVVMFAWVMVTSTVMYLGLGQSFALEEGTKEVTMGWLVASIVLGLIGAILGGLVAAVIGRSPTNRPVKVLAGIVLVLGMGMAAAQLSMNRPDESQEAASEEVVTGDAAAQETETVGELSSWQAMSEAVPPAWYSFTIPIVGLIGVLIGGSLKRHRPAGSELLAGDE
ncbi:MAG: hypothetical protein ACYS0G_10780 [Planctomycetota bacterium]|jgi:uncharacterized membrane protein YeaQ/YmgE (transglycosylase-associated protein family)